MQVSPLASPQVLIEGLQRAGREVTRAKLVAALAEPQGLETGLLPPISFGLNRRADVRGAHVVPLGRNQDKAEHVWVCLD